MTFKDLAKRISTCYNSLPALIDALRDGFNEVEGGGGSSDIEYSTEERKIGKWINGSDLYQKTISFGALPNNTSKSVNHGIENLDLIVEFSALAKRPSPFNIIPLPSSHYQSASAQQEISFNATAITVRNGNDSSAYSDVYITLQYTKTA